ncbi:hypothetical protein BDY21DRAFT_343309 [Lineolata rhizophorae]|uniref:Uncharacterized protein n=1 Tax=Lineolata rhizophorae TaxID=578093 RepID=A0A6A6P2H5_9PEZI|nr:hypothetical protein BDY21DRAFT_343309 [Lineolata rhizophorae]
MYIHIYEHTRHDLAISPHSLPAYVDGSWSFFPKPIYLRQRSAPFWPSELTSVLI